jgi:magnesium transporter
MATKQSPTKRTRLARGKGVPPGTISVDRAASPAIVTAFAYGPEGFEECRVEDLDVLPGLVARYPVTWINVDGLGTAETIQKLGELFGLHRLALEDVVNVPQRPKVEPYGNQWFVIARMPNPSPPLETEQICIFLDKKFVITFQEAPGPDCFDPIRERIRQGRPRLRAGGPDYLAYAILDSIVDSYFPILEKYGDSLDDIEARVLEGSDASAIAELYRLKRDFTALRRYIWPLRDVVNVLTHEEIPLLRDETRIHLRDCHDHTVQLMELVESFRDVSSGLVDVYLSTTGARMNEIMKVLTIIATVFIPLSFIAGIYGMNFNTSSRWNMPELDWPWGYAMSLGLMAAVAAVLVSYFWRKGWIGRSSRRIE